MGWPNSVPIWVQVCANATKGEIFPPLFNNGSAEQPDDGEVVGTSPWHGERQGRRHHHWQIV